MMSLPFDILSQNYVKPKLYLCEVDKTKICELETINMSGSFKFNAYSELTFTVPRTYINITTGETNVNPFYDKIEALRLVYLEGFGYFEIQEPELESEGIREAKNITAYSLEYTLSQKYLEDIKINKGTTDSEEVMYAKEVWGNKYLEHINPITLYNDNERLSLINLILEKVYGWTFEIDKSLHNVSREFEISRVSIYDFITQDICDKFNCFAVFDTINNVIHLHAENLSTKFYGDGKTTVFELPTLYKEIGSVTIGGYRTGAWEYNIIENEFDKDIKKGIVVFAEPPENELLIEITDGAQKKWDTDIYVSFENLAQKINVDYSAEDIKTVLTVKGADDLGIESVNMGLPYITDLSYYYSVDWMGEELYKVYGLYNKDYDKDRVRFAENSLEMAKCIRRQTFLKNRLSLEYTEATYVNDSTAGTFYVRVGEPPKEGEEQSCYYEEVKLPGEWLAGVTYYSVSDTALNTDKFSNLFKAIVKYYISKEDKDVSELKKIKEDFGFVKKYTIDNLITVLESSDNDAEKRESILVFLDEVFDQLGSEVLADPYKKYCETWEDATKDMDDEESAAIRLSVIELFTKAIDKDILDRQDEIDAITQKYIEKSEENATISNNVLLDVYFKNYYLNQGYNENEAEKKALALLIRLNPFLREDEYTDDNFVVTELDDDDDRKKKIQELLECGKVELSRLCSPKLAFSMEMANIYALPEFQPLIDGEAGTFQLGNLINVAIRDNYIKKARILGVNINFEDFSDFTCEFGELTSVRTPASIHADLLSAALTAGKSAASNTSYWNKGVDRVSNLELKIEQGLLGAIDGLYTSDQSVTIDNNGIWLRRVNEDGTFSPYQACLTSNTILMSSDGFKEGSVPKMGLGEFTIDGRTFYGILAEAVLSGYIEGCTIVGGTIKIGLRDDGKYAFEVDQKGNVSMLGGAVKFTDEVNSLSVVSNRLDQRINETNATIERTDESIAAEVTRAESVEQSLRSSIKINADAITSKVEYNDFGTLVEQNYDHVKIAWNNNSKYIAFEDGALNIYKSSSHSTNTLLMKHDYQGAWYYHNGNTVGKIGTNHWLNDTSYKGLTFDLGCDAEYMCWAHKENASDTDYTVKLIYHSNDSKEKKGLHFECDTYTNGKLYLNDTNKLILYNDNGIGYAGKVNFVDGSNTSYFRVNGTEKLFEILGGASMKIYNNVSVDCYSHINMHGFNIVDSSITTSSDARLKTNIKDSSVDALGMINQIEMKEFDWIENGEHEDIGIIAQQLQIIMPDLVIEDSLTGKLSINMSKFIPYLIKAIQQLSKDESENVSTYSLKRPASWTDQYDILTKEDFVESLKSYEFIPLSNENVEVVHQPVILPMDE